MGGLCPLFFDGAICQFEELPQPKDMVAINRIYDYIKKIRGIQTSFFTYSTKQHFKLKTFIKKLKTWQKFLF